MTGTGTQADPFVPTTWDEFVTAIGTSGAYISVPEGTVWDLNDINPTGYDSIITFNARRVSGNGVTIKNLVFRGGASFKGSALSIGDVNFYNVLCEGGSALIECYGAEKWLTNVSITGKFVDSDIFKVSDSSWGFVFRSSAINAELSGTSCIIKGNILKLTDANVYVQGGRANTTQLISPQNTLIRGSLPVGTYNIGRDADAAYYSIIDCDISSGTTISTANMTTCLINSEKIASGANVSSTLKRVTSAQLRDAAYLDSIGFPIATGA